MICRRISYRLIASSLILALGLQHTIRGQGGPAKPSPSLTNQERKLLDGLLSTWLFDPKGAQRVRLKVSVRTPWASTYDAVREGWLQKGTGASPERIVFLDGGTAAVSRVASVTPIDLVEEWRAQFKEKQAEASNQDLARENRFRRMHRSEVEVIDESPLAMAAWLHRAGHDDLAAQAMHAAREAASRRGDLENDDAKVVAALRSSLAWICYAGMVHAFMVCADSEALAAGERLLDRFPEATKETNFAQTPAIVGDLKRRQKAGTFGRKGDPLERPAQFDQWNTAKQLAWLIDRLDQIDARQMGQPGGVAMVFDPRVQAIVRIGDPAVPALIQVIESDERLTRSVHFWRDFSRDRTALGVREAALEAAMTILGTQFFEIVATGDDFTGRGKDEARQMAARLKAYWNQYGKLPFDDRMLAILTSPGTRFEAKREAARNLAHLGERRFVSTSGGMFRVLRGRRPPSPAVAKFKKPTAAEAILAAMDQDLRNHDAQPRGQLYDFDRRLIENSYWDSLVELGDRAIAPELLRRFKSARAIRDRRKLAITAWQLGDASAMVVYAGEVERGSLKLPANNDPNTTDDDQPGTVELRGMVEDLTSSSGLKESDQALFAIADPQHPYFELARNCILRHDPRGEPRWFSHPYCLTILRRELDNSKPTGATFRIEGPLLHREYKQGSGTEDIPPLLNDPRLQGKAVNERNCDVAAVKLGLLVFGLGDYHPLQFDAAARLEAIKSFLDRFRNGYRRATPTEARFLHVFGDDPVYLPNMPPLNRPANAEDVAKGRAIFALTGAAKMARLQLPAVAFWKHSPRPRDPGQPPKPLLIIQAEIDKDGKTFYGVVSDGTARRVDADEVVDVRPMRASILDLLK
jgi:hypothetical protein